jgi:hypothetical protein
VKAYSRPEIAEAVFYDVSGNVIHYGHRYEYLDRVDELTHEQTNQERFLPIFVVAQGLLDYLQAEYDVELIDGAPDRKNSDVYSNTDTEHLTRIVQVKPASSNQPSIWIGFSSALGMVEVRAGLFSTFDMWFCGCDRCDDNWRDVADSLESVILAIAKNGLTEHVDKRPWGRARYWLHPDRSSKSSGSIPRSWSKDRFASERMILRELPNEVWEGFTGRHI